MFVLYSISNVLEFRSVNSYSIYKNFELNTKKKTIEFLKSYLLEKRSFL